MKALLSIYVVTIHLIFNACRFSAVDYATNDVQIVNKSKIVVEGNPAVSMRVVNRGEREVSNIIITVKAKRNQIDLEEAIVVVARLEANESVARVAVLDGLDGHEAYDLLTYAVSYSSP